MEGVVSFADGDQSTVKRFSSNKLIELGSQTKMTGYFWLCGVVCLVVFFFFSDIIFRTNTSQGFN